MTRLLDASVDITSEQLTLTFTVSDSPPSTSTWALSTSFWAGIHGPGDHVGFKVLNGDAIRTWTFDLSDGGGQRNLTAAPRLSGMTWTLVLPRDAIRSQTGTWHADLDIDGHDAGCVQGTY